MKSLQVIKHIILTLFIVYDYFPDLPLAYAIPSGVLLWLFVGLFFVSFFFRELNHKVSLKWQVLSLTYFVSLLAWLMILGGQSTAGISFNNVFLWIFLLMSCFDIYSQWKKLKQQKNAHYF